MVSQLEPGYTLTLYLRLILIMSSHQCLDFPDVFSLQSFLTQSYAFAITPMRATLPTNPVFLYLSILKMRII
jgi:hypothetical protein